MVFDYAGNRPKWEQVAEILRARIADGVYGPDERVPSEHELVAEFDPLARGTARKIIVKLQEEGLIYSVRGLGNFVRPPAGKT